jgi:hypothetical protein
MKALINFIGMVITFILSIPLLIVSILLAIWEWDFKPIERFGENIGNLVYGMWVRVEE